MDDEYKCSIKELGELINRDFENIKHDIELYFFNNNIVSISLPKTSVSIFIDMNTYEINILNQIINTEEKLSKFPLEFWVKYGLGILSDPLLEQMTKDIQLIKEKIFKYFGSHKPDIVGKVLKDLLGFPRTVCDIDSEIKDIYYFNQLLTIEVISREKLREIKFDFKEFNIQQLLEILKIFEKDENYRW